MKDITEFSEKQQIRIDNYLRIYGICYLERKEGKKIKDVIVKNPEDITLMIHEKGMRRFNSQEVREALRINLEIKKDEYLIIEKDDLNWFQKLLLKIAGLI